MGSNLYPVCEKMLFPSLLNDMVVVVCCFNTRAKQLLEFHLATRFGKYLALLTSKRIDDHFAMIKQGGNLVKYTAINALEMQDTGKVRQCLSIWILIIGI